jgi:hypothetical protein
MQTIWTALHFLFFCSFPEYGVGINLVWCQEFVSSKNNTPRFSRTHYNFRRSNRKFTINKGIFVTPTPVILTVYFPAYRDSHIKIKRNFIFVQHLILWYDAFNCFANRSFTKNCLLCISFTKFPMKFSSKTLCQSTPNDHSLLNSKHFSNSLTNFFLNYSMTERPVRSSSGEITQNSGPTNYAYSTSISRSDTSCVWERCGENFESSKKWQSSIWDRQNMSSRSRRGKNLFF